jgi:type IV pilus assembly protein PilB
MDDAPISNANGSRLGEVLLRQKLLTTDELQHALVEQHSSGKRLGAVMVDMGVLSERDLAGALSNQLEIPLIDLGRDRPDPEVTDAIPEQMARDLVALPMHIEDGVLQVVVADPAPEVMKALEDATHKQIALFVAPRPDVIRLIDSTYRALGAIESQVQAFTSSGALRTAASNTIQQATATGSDAPVIQVVNLIIAQGLRDRASDIHIEPQDAQVRVRFRIDGTLHDVLHVPAEMGPALVSRIKIMGDMNIVERRRPQDGQTSMVIDGRPLDVRIASTPTIFGEKVTMRLLDKSKPLYRAGQLGMPPDTREAWSDLVKSPFGMVVCVGPTGSGKTTTLYATLGELNSDDRNIMTIEDPVEYILPSVNQIQINAQTGVTFADGLRSILRQDPDVILVGEVRDADTARIAVQSALTGHLVLSSLHATDTAAAIHRFLDMGIEAFLVASSLVAVVGQRLLRRSCRSCRVPYQPTVEELDFFTQAGGDPKHEFLVGEGCNLCSNTGYQDRIGVYELLRITPEIKRMIVGWATQEEIRRVATSQGMRTLLQEGIDLVESDVTTISEIVRVIYAT